MVLNWIPFCTFACVCGVDSQQKSETVDFQLLLDDAAIVIIIERPLDKTPSPSKEAGKKHERTLTTEQFAFSSLVIFISLCP
jgi:hypothetical protein